MTKSKFFLSLAALLFAAFSASAQCQSNLGYLSSQIPTVNDADLTKLRQSILEVDINKIIEQLKSQGIAPSQMAGMLMQQSDSFDDAKAKAVEGINAVSTNGAEIVRNLKARSYASVTFESILGAYCKAYVLNDWGQFAMRETAVQVACYANQAK